MPLSCPLRRGRLGACPRGRQCRLRVPTRGTPTACRPGACLRGRPPYHVSGRSRRRSPSDSGASDSGALDRGRPQCYLRVPLPLPVPWNPASSRRECRNLYLRVHPAFLATCALVGFRGEGPSLVEKISDDPSCPGDRQILSIARPTYQLVRISKKPWQPYQQAEAHDHCGR